MSDKDLIPNQSKSLRALGDGVADGFEPVKAIDIKQAGDVEALVAMMRDTSFGGRKVGEAADLLYAMVTDPDCYVVLTLSGAMTVAKMTQMITDMIDLGMVHAVVSTGALVAHGFVEGSGRSHFKVPEKYDDDDLFERGYDRVYDTLESEGNFMHTEKIFHRTFQAQSGDEPLSSADICRALGEALVEETDEPALLKSALARQVPVFIPAFTDSVLGLDFQVQNAMRKRDGRKPLVYDGFKDLDDFTSRIRAQKTTGIFTIGGGVPRNWAQQVSPYIDWMDTRIHGKAGFKPYKYGLRICPDPVHFGHLSGCTYSESVTWGKFVPKKDGGRWGEVQADATIAWPLILTAVYQRLQREGKLPIRKKLPGVPL